MPNTAYITWLSKHQGSTLIRRAAWNGSVHNISIQIFRQTVARPIPIASTKQKHLLLATWQPSRPREESWTRTTKRSMKNVSGNTRKQWSNYKGPWSKNTQSGHRVHHRSSWTEPTTPILQTIGDTLHVTCLSGNVSAISPTSPRPRRRHRLSPHTFDDFLKLKHNQTLN